MGYKPDEEIEVQVTRTLWRRAMIHDRRMTGKGYHYTVIYGDDSVERLVREDRLRKPQGDQLDFLSEGVQIVREMVGAT